MDSVEAYVSVLLVNNCTVVIVCRMCLTNKWLQYVRMATEYALQ